MATPQSAQDVHNTVFRADNAGIAFYLEALLRWANSAPQLSSERLQKMRDTLREASTDVAVLCESLRSDHGRHARFSNEIQLSLADISAELSSLLRMIELKKNSVLL